MINSISVLFVTRDPEPAGQVIGRIRYRGHAVRPKQAGNTRDLDRLLQSHRFDAVVLIDTDMDIGLEELTESLHRAGRQTPIVMLTDHAQELRLSAVESGAFAVVDTQNHEVAAAMTLKAVEYLNKGREINHLRTLLQEADRRYLLMLDSSRYPIACFHEGVATYANDTWRDCFEMDLSESLDRLTLQDLVVPDQHDDLSHILRVRQNQPENVETCETLTLRTRRGQTFDADLLLTGAVIGGEPCTVVHLSFSGGDSGLQELSGPSTAPLGNPRGLGHFSEPGREAPPATGKRSETSPEPPPRPRETARTETAPPPNPPPAAQPMDGVRRQKDFLQTVERMLADTSRSERPLGLLVCALDTGERQPDTALEMLGDALQEMLKQGLPKSATIARLEKSHCGVVLSDARRTEIETLLETLMQQVQGQTIPLGDEVIVTTSLSCGVVLADDTESSAPELLERCQQAFAEARASGGACFRFRGPPGIQQGDPEGDMIWKTRIEDAVRQNGLKLLYQPIVSLQGEDTPRYDVFVRLESDGGETYEPTDFLPAAERSGVAAPLDRWIIQHAVGALSKELERNPRTTFFVRLSQGSLEGEQVVGWLQKFLENSKVPPENVVVEFKEATLLTQLDGSIATARGLRDMGVGLCIGDFGNGLDPFKLLEQVEAGVIKLDGAYVSRLAQDDAAQESVKELTQKIHESGGQVIVPMVEDADTLAILFSMEVNLVQGYFVQPPSEQLDFDFASGL
ncbi:EAL domain-containing protein [Thioalkalivibrio sp.]|uniref:EAL domain-containing response regulator n=1 Tax=Thioalkalivibrio sp. TaxID=2093813 RepID=UPI003976AA78